MLELERKNPNAVTNPDAGSDVLFVDLNGVYYTKDENGVLTVLGNGIASLVKVGTVGLVDTYRITFDSGETFDYTVTNARSIVDIIPPATPGQPGATDTYQIDFNDGPNDTFIVYNGTNGLNGQGQPAQNNPSTIDPDDAASIGTRTAFYALEDHQHAITAASPVALGASNQEGTAASFARSDHVHLNPVIAHEALADPHPQYTTTAEAAAAAPVQSFNGRTGAITPQQADYDAFFTTPSEAAAAAPVQSVAGKQGAVTLVKADVGLANVVNPVITDVRTVTPQTLNQTLTAAASVTIPANSLVAGDAFEIDVLFGTLVNTTAASNLEVAVFINGTQNAIALAALGTTAVAAPGRGGRALFKVVFRTVGAAGTALANGTVHVNALANFASNNVTAQTVNTTAAVTLDVRVRTSAATSTGTVQLAAIEQCT